jgi:hypothetical protein
MLGLLTSFDEGEQGRISQETDKVIEGRGVADASGVKLGALDEVRPQLILDGGSGLERELQIAGLDLGPVSLLVQFGEPRRAEGGLDDRGLLDAVVVDPLVGLEGVGVGLGRAQVARSVEVEVVPLEDQGASAFLQAVGPLGSLAEHGAETVVVENADLPVLLSISQADALGLDHGEALVEAVDVGELEILRGDGTYLENIIR